MCWVNESACIFPNQNCITNIFPIKTKGKSHRKLRPHLWRKLSTEKLMLLNCGVGEDSWESLGLQGDPTSPSWRRSVLGVHWKDWCWSWNSNTLATSCEELTHWKRPWCWEGLGAGGEGDDRGWDGCMASPTRWAWVWVNSGSWWWTGRPGVLWFMGSQRVGHDWATELNWTELTEVFYGWLSDFLGSRNQLKVFCKTKKDIFRIILLIIPKEDSTLSQDLSLLLLYNHSHQKVYYQTLPYSYRVISSYSVLSGDKTSGCYLLC